MKVHVLSLLLALASVSAAFEEPQKAPRAARSVHLAWEAPPGEVCYQEMTVERSVAGSYFMPVGWNTGYFGIQEIKPGNKVVIFSVWDPTPGNDPKAVDEKDRVELLHNDPDVRIRRFGNEGTGGQSMWPFDWKIGDTYRFCLRAKVEGEKTAYAAYFYLPEEKKWKHLATFRTFTKGSPLNGYYSFVEDFRRDTKSVGETRRASFGNGWVKAVTGDWKPITTARFTASGAEWESKENFNAGRTETGFYLATGGEIRPSTPLRSTLEQPAGDRKAPQDLPEEK